MIDAHAHIQMPPLSPQWEALYDRAKAAGLDGIVLVGENIASSEEALSLAQKKADLWATIGVHPEHAGEFGILERDALEKMIEASSSPMQSINMPPSPLRGEGRVRGKDEPSSPALLPGREKRADQPSPPPGEQMSSIGISTIGIMTNKIRAIGEIGLDYHWIDPTDPVARKAQWDAFEWQIDFANRHDLPIVIHSREAGEDTLSIIANHRPKYALMHCYSYDVETAERFLAMDDRNMVAFTGILTYPSAQVLRDVCAAVSLERMVTESDCPYLAPQKYRGQQNEPAYITEIVEEIARIKNTSFEQVAQATGENARRFFVF